MATAAPEPWDLSGGDARRVRNDMERARELRQLSDRELREKAQRLQTILARTNQVWLFVDGGEKMRLYLQAILDELNRRQHALARWPRAQARQAPARRQESSSDKAVWERVQRLQAQFAGPDGWRRLRLFLETCFREVNNRGHAPACNSMTAPMVDKVGCEIRGCSIPPLTAGCAKCNADPPISASSVGTKRRRSAADEAATGSPEVPYNGEASERFEVELRRLSDQALWERAQRFQEDLAASVSARLPDGGMRQCFYLEACLRELNSRRRDAYRQHGAQ